MSFDPSTCNYVVTPFPSEHLLTDPSVPDPLEAIKDCNRIDLPLLFPEAPCPTIFTLDSTVHFNTFGANFDNRVSVNQATEECVYNFQLDLNPPCLTLEADGQFNYVPFSQGVDARLTFRTLGDILESVSLYDSCYLGLHLEIDIPAQSCPTIVSGTSDLTVLPPGEEPTLVVTATQTDENPDTSCAFSVDLDLQTPCTGINVTGSTVTFDSGSGAEPHGSIRVVTLSAVPCQFDFQVLLDLSSIVFDPIVAPAITDLCINAEGQVQSAEVTYYTWPSGEIAYSLWRSQFGFCDENRCFSSPFDFGLFNTGVNASNVALSDTCQNDPHWNCDGAPAQSMAYAAYPTVWMRPGRRSRWIAKTCSGIEPSGTIQTFSTTFTIPGDVSASEFAVEGVLNADNWVREVRVNGTAVPVIRLTDVYPGANNYELQGPMFRFMLKTGFITGTNLIEFDVDSSDFPGGDPSWLGFRVEWTGVGACNPSFTTTTTTTTTTGTPTTGGPTSSTTTTTSTTVPPGEECDCHFEQGDLIRISVELENGLKHFNTGIAYCESLLLEATVTLPNNAPLGGDVFPGDWYCVSPYVPGECSTYIYFRFFRYPTPYPTGPMRYGHILSYYIYGQPGGVPRFEWLSQFPNNGRYCLVSCDPKKYRVDFSPSQYPSFLYTQGIGCLQPGAGTYYSLLPPEQQIRLKSIEVVKL